jgi:hypothetical protein
MVNPSLNAGAIIVMVGANGDAIILERSPKLFLFL